jgi:hypothetical protein
VKPDVKSRAKAVGKTLPGFVGGRGYPDGGVLGDLNRLNLKGLDADQMDDLGGVTGEIPSALMEILAENEVVESGEDTAGADLEDYVSFSGRVTHNPVAPEFKSGSRVVYLGKWVDYMRLGYVATVNGDIEGGAPLYTVNLEGFGEKQIEGQHIFSVASQEKHVPPVPVPVPSHSSYGTSQVKKDKHAKKEYLKQMSELAKIVQQLRLENNKLEKLFSDAKR